MQELISKIEQWAHERNIINGSKPIDQAMKLFSEFGELADNVGKGRDCRDDVGDVFVVLTIMTAQIGDCINDYFDSKYSAPSLKLAVTYMSDNLANFARNTHMVQGDDLLDCIGYLGFIAESIGSSLKECVQIAYDDIKDRKGVMSNGVFIKESDPAYAAVIKSIEENCQC